jgi:hypothetical protein
MMHSCHYIFSFVLICAVIFCFVNRSYSKFKFELHFTSFPYAWPSRPTTGQAGHRAYTCFANPNTTRFVVKPESDPILPKIEFLPTKLVHLNRVFPLLISPYPL